MKVVAVNTAVVMDCGKKERHGKGNKREKGKKKERKEKEKGQGQEPKVEKGREAGGLSNQRLHSTVSMLNCCQTMAKLQLVPGSLPSLRRTNDWRKVAGWNADRHGWRLKMSNIKPVGGLGAEVVQRERQ